MAVWLYLSHPQVTVDPSVPVPRWSLSPRGRERLDALRGAPWLASIARILSSDETKAIETAAILAGLAARPAAILPGSHENDRTATGFLPPDRFEAAADAFFANPDESFSGWETARAAQARIVAAVRAAHAADPRPTLLCGHGAVGTLLKCDLNGTPISRSGDQNRPGLAGGGNLFAFDADAWTCLSDWTPLEDLPWPMRPTA